MDSEFFFQSNIFFYWTYRNKGTGKPVTWQVNQAVQFVGIVTPLKPKNSWFSFLGATLFVGSERPKKNFNTSSSTWIKMPQCWDKKPHIGTYRKRGTGYPVTWQGSQAVEFSPRTISWNPTIFWFSRFGATLLVGSESQNPFFLSSEYRKIRPTFWIGYTKPKLFGSSMEKFWFL